MAVRFFDACNRCAGGTTGVTPGSDPAKCTDVVTSVFEPENFDFEIYPNPSKGLIHIESKKPGVYDVEVINSWGKQVMSSRHSASIIIDVQHQPQGLFIIIINRAGQRQVKKVVKF